MRFILHFIGWSIAFWIFFGTGPGYQFAGDALEAARINALGASDYAIEWWTPMSFGLIFGFITGCPGIFWPLFGGLLFGFLRKR